MALARHLTWVGLLAGVAMGCDRSPPLECPKTVEPKGVTVNVPSLGLRIHVDDDRVVDVDEDRVQILKYARTRHPGTFRVGRIPGPLVKGDGPFPLSRSWPTGQTVRYKMKEEFIGSSGRCESLEGRVVVQGREFALECSAIASDGISWCLGLVGSLSLYPPVEAGHSE
jgi:hypothetical protein